MHTEVDIDEVRRLAERVPAWAGSIVDLRPLAGGITNRNFVATVDGREFVMRIPGERTELLGIDRAHEAEAAHRAAELGLAPQVVAELPDVGTLITALVPGSHLGPAAFAERVVDVASMLRRFHTSGPLSDAFAIHRVVERHARDAVTHGVSLPASFARLQEASMSIERAFAVSPLAPVPCHNDLLPANVLFDEVAARAWLLDFEYAGMNERFFDLANLSVNSQFSADTDERLLRAYLGSWSPAADARLQLMKIMSEFREGMWAVVQQAISTLDTDFVAYADERLSNCESLVAHRNFRACLATAAYPVKTTRPAQVS
jgi:thiamine kinase-like enzyme